MMTKIEWTEKTWNPTTGCSIVSPGCHNCYAMKMAHRLEHGFKQPKYSGTTRDHRWTGKVNLSNESLSIPLRTNKPTKWFVNSMSDLFHESIPDEFIDDVFAVMALCQQHTFQVLTKRSGRMKEYMNLREREDRVYMAMERVANENDIADFLFDVWPLPNVWLGVSVEDTVRLHQRVEDLVETPAAIRWISAEPLLEEVDFCFRAWSNHEDNPDGQFLIDWIVIGGESGPDSRLFNLKWLSLILEDTSVAGVPAFAKQFGARPYLPYYEENDALREWALDHGKVMQPVTGGYVDWDHQTFGQPHPNAIIQIKLIDRKGGDPTEWPEYLRVREFPSVGATV